MAEQLVEAMAGEWEPEQYRDTYRDDLLRMIDEKVKGGTVTRRARSAEAPGRRGGGRHHGPAPAERRGEAGARQESRKPAERSSGAGQAAARDRRSAWRWRSTGRSGTSRRRRSRRGGEPTAGATAGLLYVIQKHAATQAPLRLPPRARRRPAVVGGAEGALARSARPHLAARVEDHPRRVRQLRGHHPRRGVRRRHRRCSGTGARGSRRATRTRCSREGRPQVHPARREAARARWVLVRMKPRPERGEQGELAAHQAPRRRRGRRRRLGASSQDDRPRSRAAARSRRSQPPARRASGTVTAGRRADRRSAGRGLRLDPGASRRGARRRRRASSSRSWPRSSRTRPQGDDWLHEIKFDGYRAIAAIEQRRGRRCTRATTRTGPTASRSVADELARPAGHRAPCSTARWSCGCPTAARASRSCRTDSGRGRAGAAGTRAGCSTTSSTCSTSTATT